jgi:hypothetical protein
MPTNRDTVCCISRTSVARSIRMAKKRKKKTFSAATVIREMARERVGPPKPSHPVPAKKTKPEKHKPTLGKLLNED